MDVDPGPVAAPGEPPGTGRIAPRMPRARQALLVLAVVAILVSPLVFHVGLGQRGPFAWHMFSQHNGLPEYEVRVDDGPWQEADLAELSWWDRGAHVGTSNLRALCTTHPDATAARRVVGEHVDAEVVCR